MTTTTTVHLSTLFIELAVRAARLIAGVLVGGARSLEDGARRVALGDAVAMGTNAGMDPHKPQYQLSHRIAMT